MFENIDPSIFLVILPEILLLVLVGLVLFFDILWKGSQGRNLGWLTVAGIGVILIATFILAQSMLFKKDR